MSGRRKWKCWPKSEIESWGAGRKRCRVCTLIKPWSDFDKGNRNALFGLSNDCRECRKPKSKLEWANKPQVKRLYDGAKSRVWRSGVEFSIDLDDIVIPGLCPVFNVPMVVGTIYAPSLDRIDPNKGYIKGNVQVISNRANMLKNNATVTELKQVINFMTKDGK